MGPSFVVASFCVCFGSWDIQESEEKSTNLAPFSFFITGFGWRFLDFSNSRGQKVLYNFNF